MNSTRPAVLGGRPAFPDGQPFARPAVPPLERVMERLRPSYEAGILTNGPLVRLLEETVAERTGTAYAVAVSSCTTGLLLVLQALAPRGPVLLPSFTFSATAHAVMWAGHRPAFAECDATSFQLDTTDAAQRLHGIGALVATHVFGAPCPAEEVEALGREAGVPVLFDAAHAMGARRGGRPVGGFGVAEVFSMSPTKPVVAGEGGMVTTDDSGLAAELGAGRDYGNLGTYDSRFAGLNGRLSELHAALALESLEQLAENTTRRLELAQRYRNGLAAVPGVQPQRIDAGDTSSVKDFVVLVDETAFGLDRDDLRAALLAEGIDTRPYFSPPVHRQQAYAGLDRVELPVTDDVSSRTVSLPIYSHIGDEAVDRVVETIAALQEQAGEVARSLAEAAAG